MATNPYTHTDQRPRQFTTVYLFLLTLVVAFAMVPMVYWGVNALWLTVWLGLAGLAVLHHGIQTVATATLAGFGVLVAALLFPAMQGSRTPARRTQCISNIRQISVAIRIYESVNGHLPPPYLADDSGTPMHSWRVLILPYLDEQALYDQYDFNKPWNHPDNLRLETKMPRIYRCPSDNSAKADVTTLYNALVGPETAWPPSGVRKLGDVSDGLSQTLLLIESTSARTHWMAPCDVDASSFDPSAGKSAGPLLISPHTGVSVCAFCDCSTRCVGDDIPASELRTMLTIDGDDNGDLDAP